MSDQNATGDGASDVELGAKSVENKRVPPEIGENIRALFDTDGRPETFGEWTDAVAAAFGDDWPPEVELLCHDDEGRHRAETDEETYRFVCVLDAVLLPFLTDTSTVEVHSEGPETGDGVTAHVSESGMETDPEEAVLSFGVAETDEGADVTPEATYSALCPYVHAFPDEAAYERWSATVDAPTTVLPLSEGFALARALARA